MASLKTFIDAIVACVIIYGLCYFLSSKGYASLVLGITIGGMTLMLSDTFRNKRG